jgi:hypothetical protein
LAAYTERFSLPFLAQVLVAAAERRRPGLGAWGPGAADALRDTFRAELAELERRFLEVFDDPAHWARVEAALMEVCLPRYLAEAERFTALERRDFGVWRGGDLVARITFGLAGLALGAFLARAPFIPLPSSWDALFLGLGLAAPFIPDAQVWLHGRRYRGRLKAIIDDMAGAEAQQKLYPPLSDADASPSTAQPDRLGQKG